MNFEAESWIQNNLLDQDVTTFDKLGDKRVIYSVSYEGPLAAMFMDPIHPVGGIWNVHQNRSVSESFFLRLQKVVRRHNCIWFFISMPQNEYTVLQWVVPWSENSWNPARLYAFENVASEGGAQVLALLMGKGRGVLVFKLDRGFEIAYYGVDDIWNEVSDALTCD